MSLEPNRPQAACRIASIRLNHSSIWFQLAGIRDARLRPGHCLPGLRLGKPAHTRSLIPPKRRQDVRFAKADHRPDGIPQPRHFLPGLRLGKPPCARSLIPPKRSQDVRSAKTDHPDGDRTDLPVGEVMAPAVHSRSDTSCEACERRREGGQEGPCCPSDAETPDASSEPKITPEDSEGAS
jgi:hypothetical protein